MIAENETELKCIFLRRKQIVKTFTPFARRKFSTTPSWVGMELSSIRGRSKSGSLTRAHAILTAALTNVSNDCPQISVLSSPIILNCRMCIVMIWTITQIRRPGCGAKNPMTNDLLEVLYFVVVASVEAKVWNSP